LILDNQQQRKENLLFWLGGIIDGEGMVTIIKRSSSKVKQNGWNPRVAIVNTDLIIINQAIELLDYLGIPHYVQSKKNNRHPEWKIKYEIIIQGIKRCYNSLPKLIPYLVGKKHKAENLLKFCDRRLKLPNHHPYETTDLELIKNVRENKDIDLIN